MARDIENVNITLPGESDTIILNVDGEPTKVTVSLDNWRNADAELDADSKNAIQNRAVAEALDQKVDKVSGKGLSTNDYTDADKTKLADLPTDADLTAELAGKVDKETGKGLSSNDFTDAEKSKLQGIEAGAQVNTVLGVKGDAETDYRTGNVNITKANIGLGNVDNTADADKPISTATQTALSGKVDKVTGKGLSTNDFTDTLKTKLNGIATGAEVNVQANWNESDQAADSFIQNKPSIPSKTSDLTNDSGFVTDAAMQSALDQKVDKVAGKGLSTKDFTSAEKTKLAGIEAGAQVNTITGVKGNAEAAYRTGDVNITKANIGLGNVNNTSDLDKPISTAVQNELTALNSNLSQKVSSVNDIQPDTNGNVALNAEDIPAEGVGAKDVSGNPIIVTDAVAENAKNLSVDIDPIQDLHGYDHPWVGGAGKNKLHNTGVTETINGVTFTVNSDGTVLVNGTATDATNFYIATNTDAFKNEMSVYEGQSVVCSGCPSGGSDSSYWISFARLTGASIKNDTGNGVTVTIGNLQGVNTYVRINIASGTVCNNLLFEPMIRLASETDPTFEPYSNICPISGRTQVDVNRAGKNLLEDNTAVGTIEKNGGTATRNSDYSYVINGTFTRATVAVANMGTGDTSTTTQNVGRRFIPNGTYKVSFGLEDADDTLKQKILLQISQTNNASGNDDIVSTLVQEGGQFTIDDSYAYNWVRLYIGSAYAFDNVTIRPMIRLASVSDATYELYNGQTVTVQLGQTVYGGSLNVTTGELTVETANIASYNGETIGEPWWSSMDEYVAGTTPTTGAQVVYTLATPTTVNLTPAQLALLEGYNILTTDGDNINLRYTGTVASNVQSEIDEFEESTRKLAGSLAMIETSPATANHAVGSYLMLNNRLCKVTSAIATGEQIIVGSNVQYTTVAEELTAILAQINA
jgi:hypothetical protein